MAASMPSKNLAQMDAMASVQAPARMLKPMTTSSELHALVNGTARFVSLSTPCGGNVCGARGGFASASWEEPPPSCVEESFEDASVMPLPPGPVPADDPAPPPSPAAPPLLVPLPASP